MTTKLVLVVDQAHARVFHSHGHPIQLSLLEAFENPQGRLREGELVSDSQSGRTASYEPNVSAKETVVNRFFKQVVTGLKQHTKNKPCELTLVAGPRVLGEVRREIATISNVEVVQEIHKDLSEQDSQGIERYL